MIIKTMDNFNVIIIGILSTLISIIIIRPIAIILKLIDYPDDRKQHKGEIPLIGGICIFFGVIVYLLYLPEENFTINIILIFTLFVLILGVYDDLKNLKPKIKLFIQLFLVIMTVYLSEIKIESLGYLLGLPFPQDLGLLSIPFTIISIMGLMNAFNMIDGLDGQAGLTSFLALIGIFIFGLDEADNYLYKILLIILSGLIVFLIFNFSSNKKMKIFLGDGGSLFLGFLISFSLIYCTQILNIFSPSFALWCVAVPLFDFFSVVILRKTKKQNLIQANRDHIHHFLETFNFPKTFISFLTFAFGLVSLSLGYYLEINFPSLSFWIFILLFLFYLSIRLYYEQKVKNKKELF